MAVGKGEGGSRFGYRPELDGLRTFAVLVVVAYHAEIQAFSNGYLGVDVFFVLSGFLVTNVLLSELSNGENIDILRFYARRVRRLLPAASVTIIASLIAMRLVADPTERVGLGDDATSAALWFANFNVIQDLRYGEELPSPLRHFWSLSIEEQFYLLFPPALLVAAHRLRTRATLWVWLALATGASALAQLAVNWADWSAAYYSTPTRAYQILAGATLAAALRSHGSRIPQLPAAAGGLALALIGLLTLDIIPALEISGRGLITTTLVVILLTSTSQRSGATSRFLSWAPLVYLGGLSYAIYLFHVPIGVIGEFGYGQLAPTTKLLVTAIGSIALAAISAVVIEQPVRRAKVLDGRNTEVVVGGVVSALVVGLVLTPLLT